MIHNITLEQLGAVLDVLPAEVAFIDADDNVRLWNRECERGPAWQPSALGGPVQGCHTHSSIPAVNAVLARLKSGARDVVDRVVTTEKGITRFRWFAVRDDADRYLGTVELVQYGPEVSREKPSLGEHGDRTSGRLVRYSASE